MILFYSPEHQLQNDKTCGMTNNAVSDLRPLAGDRKGIESSLAIIKGFPRENLTCA